jgi:hypothetical protein
LGEGLVGVDLVRLKVLVGYDGGEDTEAERGERVCRDLIEFLALDLTVAACDESGLDTLERLVLFD